MASTDVTPPEVHPSGSQYLAVQASPEFQELRTRLRRFVFPTTIFFLVWYASYVLLGAFGWAMAEDLAASCPHLAGTQWIAANIAAGMIDVGIGGGTESMSTAPGTSKPGRRLRVGPKSAAG